MDELIVQGIGGYSDRNDFIQDAIVGLLLDLKYASDDPPKPRGTLTAAPTPDSAVGPAIAISWPARISALPKSDAEVVDLPLMGLHNRDFPSLWAAAQVAEITANGERELQECFDEVLRRAWKIGEKLVAMESLGSQRYSALFPTNSQKAAASEANFRAFAMGRVVGNSVVKTSGPLFQWGLCGIKIDHKNLSIGMLSAAAQLFEQLDGISAVLPHGERQARVFLNHIKNHAPADYGMFIGVLDLVAKRPTRQQLISDVMTRDHDWSQEQANSYVAGYIARAREWGFVELKMLSGAYSLTALGDDIRLKARGFKEIRK